MGHQQVVITRFCVRPCRSASDLQATTLQINDQLIRFDTMLVALGALRQERLQMGLSFKFQTGGDERCGNSTLQAVAERLFGCSKGERFADFQS